MRSSALPNVLNLIFHGPWGFVVQSERILAAAPAVAGHAKLLGDRQWDAANPGVYRFGNEGVLHSCAWVDPAAPPAPLLPQTVIAAPPKDFAVPTATTPGLYFLFDLPRTMMRGTRCVLRGSANGSCDSLLNGSDWNALNHSNGTPVYLALTQVLQYTFEPSDFAAIRLLSPTAWAPDAGFSGGAPSVNLHIFNQTPVGYRGADDSDHFAEMAQLLGLKIFMDGTARWDEQPEADANLPAGISAADLMDLDAGAMPPAMRSGLKKPIQTLVAKFPPTCGGNLIVLA